MLESTSGAVQFFPALHSYRQPTVTIEILLTVITYSH